MAITAALSALDTTWTEFSIVSITAGTLDTLSSCIDEVGSKLQRGTLSATTSPKDSDVARWITRAKEELAESKHFSFKRRYMNTTLTAGTHRYSLPPDYDGGYVTIKDITNDRDIPFVSNHVFDTQFPDMSGVTNGDILVATIRNLELQVGPAPNGSDVIEIEYDRSGDDATGTDLSWLPEIERFRICDYATGEAFYSIHQWQEGDKYFARWNYGLRKAQRADGKRQMSAGHYRARSVFQA